MKKLNVIAIIIFFIAITLAYATKPTVSTLMKQEQYLQLDKKVPTLQDDIKNEDLDEELRPILKYFVDSENGLFRVHYDLEGRYAVDNLDENQNNIPDYVDSVLYYSEYVHNFYSNELGYRPFAYDDGRGGSKAYDIYCWECGSDSLNSDGVAVDEGGYYGQTWNYGTIPNSTGFLKQYSYVIIDNNYSLRDSVYSSQGNRVPAYRTTNGYDALKVTLAHELHHSLQFTYGVSPQTSHRFQEMTSVFYEWRVFPEIKDYHQYVNKMLYRPDLYVLGLDGYMTPYSHGILFQYLYKKYGDYMVKGIWDMAYNGIEHFTALDSLLKKEGSSLNEALGEYADWLYHSGSRADGDKYFDDANDFIDMNFFGNNILFYNYPELSEGPFLLEPMEFRLQRVAFPEVIGKTNDTLDILHINPDINSAIKARKNTKEVTWLLNKKQADTAEKIIRLDYFFHYHSENPDGYYILYSKPGTQPVYLDSPFPNPFYPNETSNINFPAPKEANIYDKAVLFVYTVDMKPIVCEEGRVEIRGDNKSVLTLENAREKIKSPGVYIYRVEHAKGQTIGKFTVKFN